jgi:hypothetical protein
MPRRGTLHFEISGGYGPVQARALDWSVPLVELTEEEVAAVDHALSNPPTGAHSPDARTYRLTVQRGSATRSVTLSDLTMPTALRMLSERAVASVLRQPYRHD